jgi:outer membrane lipoprotein-sorting protein
VVRVGLEPLFIEGAVSVANGHAPVAPDDDLAAWTPIENAVRQACSAVAATALLMLLTGAGGEVQYGNERGPLTLETLMRRMATTSGVRAEFHELKEIALLDRPLESAGTLYVVPPRRMAHYTTRPTRSAFVVDGLRLSFRDETGGESVDLSANHIARAVVENFVVLFNGDLEALRTRYDVGFEAQGPHWKLNLVPRDSRVITVVSRVVLRGSGVALEQMVVSEAGGDRTVTTFHDVRTDVRFSEAELARIFSLDPNAPPP